MAAAMHHQSESENIESGENNMAWQKNIIKKEENDGSGSVSKNRRIRK